MNTAEFPGTIGVVIPVFNHAKYLAQALDSVLAQTVRPAQIIVVDDGSNDDPGAVVALYPKVQFVRQPHGGISVARNTGLEALQTDWVSFLDADDFWSPNRLQLQLAAVEQDPALEMIFGAVRQFLDTVAIGRCRIPPGAEVIPGLIAGTMLIRRAAFDRVGPFDPELRLGEFMDWYSRAQSLAIRESLLPDILLHRRIHDANTGLREPEARKDFSKFLKSHLDRRRQAAAAVAMQGPA